MSFRPVALLCTAALALSACTQVTTPARSGAGRTLGTYELTLRGPVTVGRQAFVSSDPALSFQRVSVTTIDDSTSGQQYVHSLYRVTNTGSVPLTNLTFLPTNTDEDADPSTVTVGVPTIGSTEFKSVSFFDQSDASSVAPFLSTGQARVQVTQGVTMPVVQVDPDATPFRSALAVGGVTPGVPGGQVATVKPYGWLLSGTLQPGESTNLDLAASVGGSRKPYAFNVVLTVTEDDSSFTPVPVTDTVREVSGSDASGTLKPWTGGAVSVREVSGDRSGNANGYALVTGSIDASGQLALKLASDREMTGLSGGFGGAGQAGSCTSTVASSDAALNTVGFEYLTVKASGGNRTIFPADHLNLAAGQATTGLYLYADRGATLNGVINCNGAQKTYSNVTLHRGWNLLRQDTAGPSSVVSNGSFPVGWVYTY